MKELLLFLVSITLFSCSTESIDAESNTVKAIDNTIPYNTFTVKWSSNQEGSYVEFNKHVFKNCEVISTVHEEHREHEFDITLDNGQMFDMQIRHTIPQKYPELYLSIYKGSELQYEQEINTQGFLMTNFCNGQGNISK